MSRLIRPCPDCPGVRYEGEPCRCCEAIAQARREGLERVAALEAALREAVGYLTAEADIHAGAEEGYHKGFEAGLAYSQHDADRCTCGNVKRGRPCKMDCPNQGGTTGSYSLTSPDHPYVMHGTVRTTDPVLVTEPGPEDLQPLVDELRRRVVAMTAEANAAAMRHHMRERYHDAQLAGWRQVCLDHGIAPDAGSLRVHLEDIRDCTRSIDRLLRLAGREVGR